MHWLVLLAACSASEYARSPIPAAPAGVSDTGTTPAKHEPDGPQTASPNNTSTDSSTPNILLVVIDDLGVDYLTVYGAEGSSIPETPTLDSLADAGLRFTKAWSSPLCSPSRAEILTGLHARRFDLGTAIRYPSVVDLPQSATAIPEHLGPSWSTAFLGKWHLTAGDAGLTGPLDQGFDHWSGSLGNLAAENSPTRTRGLGYTNWERVSNGVLEITSTYATTATADDAIHQVRTLAQPWFIEVAFHAGHGPYHFPPEQLVNRDWASGPTDDPHRFGAMIEALDTELGRILSEVDASNTVVMVVGDNGTPQNIVPPPAKGSTAEAGINVPLLMRGPGIAAGITVTAPVSLVDLPATILDLAGVTPTPPLDGASLRTCFTQATCQPHSTVTTSVFTPNGEGPYDSWMAAVRDDRYKLVEGFHAELKPEIVWSLYDMNTTGETVDLLEETVPDHVQPILDRLHGALDAYMSL